MELWYSLVELLPFDWAQSGGMYFMKNALLAVLVISPLFGILSTMVVHSRMSFFSDALGHSAFTGMAIGAICGFNEPTWAAVAFAVVFALLFTYVRRKSNMASDTVIGVFSSTAATYGEPEKQPIEECDRTDPTNPYGATKLAIEGMLKWCDKAYGIHYVALRYFNAAGSNPDVGIGEDHNPESHLIPLVMKTALGQRDHIGIFGDDYPTPDGTCVRDYIHVRDLAEAHLLALEHLEKTGESGVFNLGSGDGYSVKEIIDTARRITGKEIPAKVEPRRAGDPSVLIASNHKAAEVLGWTPKRGLEEIIADAWTWHSGHPNGYEN